MWIGLTLSYASRRLPPSFAIIATASGPVRAFGGPLPSATAAAARIAAAGLERKVKE